MISIMSSFSYKDSKLNLGEVPLAFYNFLDKISVSISSYQTLYTLSQIH